MLFSFKKIYFDILIVFCILFLLWLSGLFWFGYLINTYKQDIKTKTDAIVVLTGGRNRIHEAIKLLNADLAPKLFISGVSKNIGIKDIEKMALAYADHEEKIELGRRARSTVENANEVGDWCQKNQIHSLRLVTSNYHIPRSMAELSVYLKDMKIILSPVYSEKVTSKWWTSWGVFKLISMEYNKYLIVRLRNLYKG